MAAPIQKTRKKTPLLLFGIGLFLAGIVSTAFSGTFHNYLHDLFGIGADSRGMLEFPRELPGLLATVLIAILFFLGEISLLAISILFVGIGLLGMGFLSPDIPNMIVFMILWSIGSHLHMILIEPVAIRLSSRKKKGEILGKVNGMRSAGKIIGTILIWFLMGKAGIDYRRMYLGAFLLASAAGVLYFAVTRYSNKDSSIKKPRFNILLRKEYGLFYALAALFGIRKQLFLVFAPWLLIKLYGFESHDIAVLLLISASLGIFLKPLMGKMIDYLGEKKVLTLDALLIFILSITYAFIPGRLDKPMAIILLGSCFVVDELLFSLRTARTTYLYKILHKEEDLTPTLSVGISIEHIMSMTLPGIAGIVWIRSSHHWVFLMAAVAAVFSGLAASQIRVKQ